MSDLVSEKINFSLLIVKPEAFLRRREIKSELVKRGYQIQKIIKKTNFSKYIGKIYKWNLPKRQFDSFTEAYSQKTFNEFFCIIFVFKKGKNTISSLAKDVGHSKSYLVNKDGSLRSLYGLERSYYSKKNDFTIYFNGLHKPDNLEELNWCLKVFNIHI